MNKPILIHYKNTKAVTSISNQISFEIKSDNIDLDIIDFLDTQIFIKELDVIVIKDSLSKNYLEFYGLLLAHHIRLSNNKKEKYLPIVIISDLDIYQLCKLTQLANICYTEGVYLIDNELTEIDNILKKDLKGLDTNNFDTFLNLINIEPPSNYDSRHSIANEWSILRWSEAFDINIDEVEANISSMLYFKYLIANNQIEDIDFIEPERPKEEGTVLLIDDEWEKGWDEIFKQYLDTTDNITFKTLKNNYKNMKSNEIVEYVIGKLQQDKNVYPDVIILDLRLCDDDFEINREEEITQITGMQLIKEINKINHGIQIILWTASGDSNILNKTNLLLEDEEEDKYKILGYIKKEYPGDRTADVYNSIKNLSELIDKGLKDKHLKDIWITRKEILKKLEEDPIKQYIDETKIYKNHLTSLKKEVAFVFNVLDTDMTNRFNYAVVSMARSLEVIENIFFKDDGQLFWDGETVKNSSSIKEKILSLIRQKLNYVNISDIDDELEKMIRHRNAYMHSKNSYRPTSFAKLKVWFELFDEIINKIVKPLPKTEEQIEAEKIEAEKIQERRANKKPINLKERRAKLQESKDKKK